jgi:heptosyltransferase-2
MLKMTARKWRLVRAFEMVMKAFLPLLQSPRTLGDREWPPKSILVMEYWNLGDLAIVVPFLKNLRRIFPTARISLLVNAGLATFLEGQGVVDEFIPVRVPWVNFSRWLKYNPFSANWISLARTLRAVRKKKFDWAFSGRVDVRDNFLMWLTGAARRIGYGFGGGGFLLTDCVTPDLSHTHRADTWVHLLEAMGQSPNRESGGFRLAEAEVASAEAFLRERGIPSDALLIGVHPGARIATRRWGGERFAEVARRIVAETDVYILWFSDPGDPSEAPRLERCHTASLDFRSFLAVLSRCQLLVCNDSGPMHLANLLNVPVVAVFGPQRPEWFGPRAAKDRVVIRSEFWCRPCFDYCIYDQPYCLRAIGPEQVIQEVSAAMEEIRGAVPRAVEKSVGAAS